MGFVCFVVYWVATLPSSTCLFACEYASLCICLRSFSLIFSCIFSHKYCHASLLFSVSSLFSFFFALISRFYFFLAGGPRCASVMMRIGLLRIFVLFIFYFCWGILPPWVFLEPGTYVLLLPRTWCANRYRSSINLLTSTRVLARPTSRHSLALMKAIIGLRGIKALQRPFWAHRSAAKGSTYFYVLHETHLR